MKAKKKPVVVDARGPLNTSEVVVTAHGRVRAEAGDYVLTDPSTGDTWPIKPDIFAATYEREDGSTAIVEIAAERRRQIEEEGWDAAHDAEHDGGELACAAAAYALNAGCLLYPLNGNSMIEPPEFWMWRREWWKPKGARRDLVRAGALIAAEIDKLDRERKAA